MQLMVAVFDYNSRQDSPNRGGMELELSFSNGDTITVYGGMVSGRTYTHSLTHMTCMHTVTIKRILLYSHAGREEQFWK